MGNTSPLAKRENSKVCSIQQYYWGHCPDIGLAVRVFASGPGDQSSVIPKTQKTVLDASLLNTQHYKVRIKGKVEQSRERSNARPYTSM